MSAFPKIARQEKIWLVYSNSDLTEGKGRQYVKHYCKLEATAIRLAKGAYIMGSDAPIVESVRIQVGTVWYYPNAKVMEPIDYDLRKEQELKEERQREVKRKRLLSKLEEVGFSEEDIELLITS